jgi:hypothetical protein
LEPTAAILPSVTTTLTPEITFSPSNTRALRMTKDDALISPALTRAAAGMKTIAIARVSQRRADRTNWLTDRQPLSAGFIKATALFERHHTLEC